MSILNYLMIITLIFVIIKRLFRIFLLLICFYQITSKLWLLKNLIFFFNFLLHHINPDFFIKNTLIISQYCHYRRQMMIFRFFIHQASCMSSTVSSWKILCFLSILSRQLINSRIGSLSLQQLIFRVGICFWIRFC